MSIYTNRQLLQLRDTLKSLKQQGAFEGNFKLQYAADKTLRELTAEYGNSDSHVLETYDDMEQEMLEDHAEEDEEGRTKYVHQRTGAVIVRNGEDDPTFYYAEAWQNGEERHDAGDKWGDQERARKEAGYLGYKIEDQEALQEDIDDLRDEETEADLHKIRSEALQDIDLEDVGRSVDTSILELMEK